MCHVLSCLLSWPHPPCYLIIGSCPKQCVPCYPPHLLPIYSPCVCSPVPDRRRMLCVLCVLPCLVQPCQSVFPYGVVFVCLFCFTVNKKPFSSCNWVLACIPAPTPDRTNWPKMRTQQKKGLHRPPASTLASPLYKRILQFKALSSLRQQGTDMRRFALEFSNAAEGLGFNDAALKDVFNSALDDPLNWWRMRGLDRLTFGGICGVPGTSPS